MTAASVIAAAPAPAVAPEILEIIEEALVGHQAFGDSAYIAGQLEVAFVRRLERVARELPAAADLLPAFHAADAATRRRIAGNTVIRCAVQHAFTHLETGKGNGLALADCAAMFTQTLTHLQQGRPGSPFENGAVELPRLGPEPWHGWVWREEYPDDAFGRGFRKILDVEYGGGLCSLEEDELAMLRQGEELLRELLPALARSALSHAHLVGCFPDNGFWKGKVSSSQIRMGGVIFLNRKMLRNPWCTAEHLLHESLHQKLYDFRHGHSLLDVDAPLEDAPRVVSLWNAEEFNKANHWDTHRAFAAFHVYVQLALLASVAERRAPELEARYGPFRGMVSSRKALDRARYLGEQLGQRCATQIGLAGERMRLWLMTILDHLDPAPPPPGATIHLMLDLFVREGNRLESLIADSDAAAARFAGDLARIAESEIAATREILSSIGDGAARARFDAALAGAGAPGFPAIRRLIARTLTQASPDGFELSSRAIDGGDPDARVRRLVEQGSESLYLMQANVPAAVAGAKRRAKDLRFVSACEDGVGRLLAVLAAAVPRGGRILEVGTGVGVGLAWIVAGLARRDDVELVSIEGDLRLVESARGWDWPATVRILAGDARDLLPDLGRFDLVFVDAAPVKYGPIDAMVRLLRPGGMLLIDDLCATAEASADEMRERDGLRQALLRHPDLQSIELEWASRLVLATWVGDASQHASSARGEDRLLPAGFA